MLYLTTYRSPLGPMTLVARTGADLPEGGALVVGDARQFHGDLL